MTSVRPRVLTHLTAVALAAGAATFAVATPAHADTAHGCVYPRVCFYLTYTDFNNNKPAAAYKDYGLQNLGPLARQSTWVLNTRNDDGALIRTANGTNYCFLPNKNNAIYSPITIDIRDSLSC
ncbi:hypothetical protein ACIA5C_47545 [Actinoplanes sp. NPDC051343]|uniref:hypothetical protein n=1 Tax=Actinoplanes sp. NPDC051343 TaxID=3363906 RepID=UPI0037B6EA7A